MLIFLHNYLIKTDIHNKLINFYNNYLKVYIKNIFLIIYFFKENLKFKYYV